MTIIKIEKTRINGDVAVLNCSYIIHFLMVYLIISVCSKSSRRSLEIYRKNFNWGHGCRCSYLAHYYTYTTCLFPIGVGRDSMHACMPIFSTKMNVLSVISKHSSLNLNEANNGAQAE